MNGLSTTRQLTDAIVPAGTERSLPIVPLDPGTLDVAGVRQFALVAQSGTSQFSAGVTTNTLGYNGALLGPALKLRTGERTQIRVHNGLTEETTVHWHGLLVAADIDGGPHQTIAPGAQWQASFVVANPAATCWFHPHTHGATGRQVVQGLAGLLIVDDSALNPSTLPSTWGVDDVALVLQDKRFDAQGQIDYVLSTNDRQMGYMGDVLLVNGTAGAVWRAPQQWVRMRMLNGCNARTLTLRLGSGAPMLQIANEAGLLTGPVSRASITLAPGERAEVLVDFSAAVATQSIPLYAGTASDGMGMGASTSREVTALRIVASVPRQPNAMAQPPASLIAAAPVVAQVGATVRTFRLDGGMMGSPFTINGRGFDINRIDLSVPADTVEIWTFTNATDMAHPMHVHGVKMTMLTRGGVAPPVYEQGLRDTFVIEAMQTVQVAVQTAAVASSSPLMYHCHILEHEDAGMMGQFITV
jgi:FtsP/CotA-like multicopper oxidase with cupredoxin domain